MASHPIAFAAGSLERGRRALASVERAFRAQREPAGPLRELYLDTFDWLVHEAGGNLAAVEAARGALLVWRSREGGLLHRMLVAEPPAFARDLEPSPMRDALLEVTGERRLSPVARLDQRRTTLRIVDDGQKTVVWLALEHGTMSDPENGGARHRLVSTLQLTPVRGYDAFAQRLARFLLETEGLEPVDPDRLSRALAAARRAPGGRSSKLRVQLDPRERAAAATGRVLQALLETVRLNERGLRDDVDTEFLHDSRVAVRRTRAALAQVGDVLPADALRHFNAEFKWLGKATNELRDLDVHLLELPAQRAALPEADRGGLDPLETVLRERRELELRRVVTALDSERYATLMREWDAFLRRLAAPVPPRAEPGAAGRPIRELAAERIRQAHHKVVERGRAIDAATPPAELHRLRISCKKLRYLLEFFASAFDEGDLKALVKGLKVLQDNLGALNDLEVQAGALRHMLRELSDAGRAGEDAERAVGFLTAEIEARRRTERERFEQCFAAFDRAKMHGKLRRVLGGNGAAPA